MECYVHVGEAAVGACVGCGQFVCDVCRVTMGGRIYCKACLERGTRAPSGEVALRRSRRERLLSGLCGGMAEYWETDVSLIRLIWVIVTICTGIFPLTIVYFIMWAVIPSEPAE
jgi:phage shock protein PspC (stress-responsive transcriptional regulator)